MHEAGAFGAGALSAAEIRDLLAGDPPLASGLEDPELQIQPNGLDVRVESVWLLDGPGWLGTLERTLPERRQLQFDSSGRVELKPGAYVVRLCEAMHLPPDLLALGFSRSSLLRSGCALLNAIWDAGYHGRSEVLLTVFNPEGFRLERGARIGQLVFFRLDRPGQVYRGAYQGENL